MGKLLLLLLIIAVVVYFVVRTIETRGHPFRRTPGGGGLPNIARPKRRPTRPVAPDDDPEFLRDLNRRRPRRSDPDKPE
ncbi:hypothetical protein [Nocardioides alcanivorans]|uniref:hypothetical protein n=1 Tax=Nocardioides alcanivorans TaxID=2897352 RepID=UPI001F41DA94|nr:hypothetical protein [Nocardioides alcanivorans]